MWFADVGQVVACVVAGVWAVLVALRPSPVPPRLLVGTGVAVALFGVQAVLVDTVEDLTVPGVVDERVLTWFVGHRSPPVTAVMTVLSTIGGTAGMAVLALLGAVLLWWWARRAAGGGVRVAAVGACRRVPGLKNLYGRARPPVADHLAAANTFALPSGHALGSIVVVGVLTACVLVRTRQPGPLVAALGAGLLVVAIGVSRLYLGVHWTTDVLTGWSLGGSWLALCVTALVLVELRSPAAGPEQGPRRSDGRRSGLRRYFRG